MKRTIRALVALNLLTLLACTDGPNYLEVEHVVIPDTTDGCSFQAATGNLERPSDEVEVTAMQTLNGGTLSRYVGLQVHNSMNPTPLLDANNKAVTTINEDDVDLTDADLTALDESGNSFASAHIQFQSYIAASSEGVAIMDYMAKPIADALLKRNKPFQMRMQFTLHGHMPTGQSVDTQQFTYPVDVRYDDIDLSAFDGGLPFGVASCE